MGYLIEAYQACLNDREAAAFGDDPLAVLDERLNFGDESISLQDYQEQADDTLATTEPAETMKLAVMGLCGELGEIAEPIKKHLFSGHSLDTAHIEEEVGDFLWYLAILCNSLGISMEQALQKNMDKLARRYPGGFSCEKSINRAL